MKRLRESLLLPGVLALGLLAASAVPAYPPDTVIEITYYSDASHSTVVGMEVYGACVPHTLQGRRTDYSQRITEPCSELGLAPDTGGVPGPEIAFDGKPAPGNVSMLAWTRFRTDGWLRAPPRR